MNYHLWSTTNHHHGAKPTTAACGNTTSSGTTNKQIKIWAGSVKERPIKSSVSDL
jgi:hypothetical protein